MQDLVTRESLMRLLETKDPAQVIGRALWALFQRQTQEERRANTTHNTNFVGFSQPDARSGCLTAKYWKKHGTLLDWQVEQWMKDWRGYPRIVKYYRQLNQIANEKRQS